MGALLAVTCLVVVGGRAALEPEPPRAPPATAEQRAEISARMARLERAWRATSRRRFPSDLWSQDDDFHRLEQEHARRLAARLGVPVSDVLRAMDDGLRTDTKSRRATAAPCKPRPFYD